MTEARRNVLVTGASRGLGLAIARQAVADGFKVLAMSRRTSDGLEALAKESGQVVHVSHDLSDVEGLHNLVRKLDKEHGRLYGLVNNAALGRDGVLATMHESQIEELVRVNLLGSILLAKYAVRSMLLGGEGRIVNVSSIIAQTGFNGLSVYAATKAGLIGFTKSLARELGKAKITVNAVAPGYMQTDMTAGISAENLERIRRRSPLGRLAHVDEVASTVTFLLGSSAAAMTGTVVTVDAGATA